MKHIWLVFISTMLLSGFLGCGLVPQTIMDAEWQAKVKALEESAKKTQEAIKATYAKMNEEGLTPELLKLLQDLQNQGRETWAAKRDLDREAEDRGLNTWQYILSLVLGSLAGGVGGYPLGRFLRKMVLNPKANT